jgi:hypothetical protein
MRIKSNTTKQATNEANPKVFRIKNRKLVSRASKQSISLRRSLILTKNGVKNFRTKFNTQKFRNKKNMIKPKVKQPYLKFGSKFVKRKSVSCSSKLKETLKINSHMFEKLRGDNKRVWGKKIRRNQSTRGHVSSKNASKGNIFGRGQERSLTQLLSTKSPHNDAKRS